MRTLVFSLLASFVTMTHLVSATEIPDVPDVAPGIESGEWSVEPWANPGAAERSDAKGKKLLRLFYVPAGKEKTAFRHVTGMGIAKKGKLSLHVYSEKAIPLSIALSTTPAFLWHESKPLDLKAGWNKLEFDTANPTWKTASSEWKFTQDVDSPGDVRAVDLIVHNPKAAGELYVIGFQYDADDASKQVEKLAKDLGSDDADTRAKSEKAILELGNPAIEVLAEVAAREDKPEIQIRARLLIKALETPAQPVAAERGDGQSRLAIAIGEEGAPGAPATPAPHAVAPRPANLNEVLANAEAHLQTLRTEVTKLHDESAALIKALDEASNLVKQLEEKKKD
jgi:hypothetical protein